MPLGVRSLRGWKSVGGVEAFPVRGDRFVSAREDDDVDGQRTSHEGGERAKDSVRKAWRERAGLEESSQLGPGSGILIAKCAFVPWSARHGR